MVRQKHLPAWPARGLIMFSAHIAGTKWKYLWRYSTLPPRGRLLKGGGCSGELVDMGAAIWESMSGSQSKRMDCNSIRKEIYKAYPWLGPAQVPAETDEFVAMAGVAQMDGSHWVPGGCRCYTETVALQYRQRFHYVLKKCLSNHPTSPPHSAVVIPAASLIVIMLDCCNFRSPRRQWFCDARGEHKVRLLSFHKLQRYLPPPPHKQANRISVSLSKS